MTTKTAGRHSDLDADWYTPTSVVTAARTALGGTIDLDPMSEELANLHIRAGEIFTAADDGLAQEWYGRVFLNPAGGLVNAAWRKLTEAYESEAVRAFVWIGYSVEQFQTLQSSKSAYHPLDFHLCIPSRRIAFVESPARRARRRDDWLSAHADKPFRETPSSPSHANYICGFGMPRQEFLGAFRSLGVVRLKC